MSGPKRIQLSRAKGWRMPANTVRCCRPGPWGNPFRVVRKTTTIGTFWTAEGPADSPPGGNVYVGKGTAQYYAVKCFREHLDTVPGFRDRIRQELAGKNLACWCPLPANGLPDHCHARVLLEIAND